MEFLSRVNPLIAKGKRVDRVIPTIGGAKDAPLNLSMCSSGRQDSYVPEGVRLDRWN